MFQSVIALKMIIIISRSRGGIRQGDPVSWTRFARMMRIDLHGSPTVECDDPILISATKVRKSKNTSSFPAVRVWPWGRWRKRNTICFNEMKMGDSSVSDPTSAIKQTSSAPARPRTKPNRAARTDTCLFLCDEVPVLMFVRSHPFRPSMMRMKITELPEASDKHDSNNENTLTWADLEWWEVQMNNWYWRYSTISQIPINNANHKSHDHLKLDDKNQ